jgi:GNAT superfamily N-acetyltransferase
VTQAAFRIERLPGHDRAAFSCGVPALDRYFKTMASQDARRGLATCFVAVDPGTGSVAGFYTLSAASIETGEYPEKKNVGHYNRIPAALLGRLAVSLHYKGQGLGTALLYDAMRRVADNALAAAAIIVDAKDEAAAAFYQHHGFLSFGPGQNKLYLPIKDVRRLFVHGGSANSD